MAVELMEKQSIQERLRFVDDDGDDDEMRDFSVDKELPFAARKQVELLLTIARGFMLITGDPGSGKDLFAVSTASLFKYFFGRKIILDFLPRKLFGAYTLMDAPTIVRKIKELAKAYKVQGIEESGDPGELSQWMEEATKKWLLEGEGYNLFHRAVYYASELKPLAYNRNPMARTNKFIGSLGTVWRHLDLLFMGTHVYANEIDVKAFLQYAKLRAVCTQTLEQDVFKVRVHRGMYAEAGFVVTSHKLRPVVFTINGREPRDYLGGKSFYDLYKTRHMAF
jgi:hypothetical protein